ncbi:MAG: LysR family transcriptional regulator [Pseudomonadota bacterium]
MDLNWLRDFECLARLKNFTRASDERNITQSAFSRRIKALENWVGLPLINRATYPVQLTAAGQQFLPVAQAAISQLTDARQILRAAEQGEHGFVRFSVLHTISVNFLVHRLEALQSRMPGFRTRVVSDSLSTCCELLVEGAIDIMLCYAHGAVSPQIDETVFERKHLLVDPMIPVAAAGPVREHGWSLESQGIPPIPYLAYEGSSFLGMVVDQIITPHPPNIQTIYVDGLVEAIKRRLLAGSGFAWLPKTAIARELAEGRVVPIGTEAWQTPLSIVAYANPAQFDQLTQEVWEAL